MLRSLLIREGHDAVWLDGEAQLRPPTTGERLWVDVEAPSAAELAALRDAFELHPVAIEDCARVDLRPKLDAHLSIVSNRTNAIMKSLTLLSAIFLPLSFVTGFFGQNFVHLPFDNVALMWLGLGMCLLLPLGMMLWFKSRKWL